MIWDCLVSHMKIAAPAYIFAVCLHLLSVAGARAQSGAVEQAVEAKLEAIPREERLITMRNAASFTENDWRNFLKDLAQNYVIGPDGRVIATQVPDTEQIPVASDPSRFKSYLSWRMVPSRAQPFQRISGTVAAVPGPGVLLISTTGDEHFSLVPVLTGAKSLTHAEGDTFQAWCQQGQPYTYLDEFAQARVVRAYTPVELKKPELIEISNYLVKGGRIFGLAPSLSKMCPVCKGFRKFSPNPEVPSETVPCTTCEMSGKIQVRPLYIVYTGSKDL